MTVLPEGVACVVPDCPLPPAGLRPTQQDWVIQDQQGRTVQVVPAGEADEIVCEEHLNA